MDIKEAIKRMADHQIVRLVNKNKHVSDCKEIWFKRNSLPYPLTMDAGGRIINEENKNQVGSSLRNKRSN